MAKSVVGRRFYSVDAWLEWFETLHPEPIALGLDRVTVVAKKLNCLTSTAIVVTIAGTNGKGSTCAYLESIYLQAGYRVGCYTSPHLLKFNERIRIAGLPVTDQALITVFAQIDQARDDISLTYFEFATLAALVLFAGASLDLLILEVGLGGRLDAVNIIDADIAVITTVALDHCQWLGNDIDSIAYEKAGIARSNKALVLGDQAPSPAVLTHAKQLNTPTFIHGQQFGYQPDTCERWLLWITTGLETEQVSCLANLSLGIENAATAAQVCALLNTNSSLKVAYRDLTQGLSTAALPGRFQQIQQQQQRYVLDVAHNPQAGQRLAKKLKNIKAKPSRWLAIIGILDDKDIVQTCQPLLTMIDYWYVVGLKIPRAAKAVAIKQALQQAGQNKSFTCDNVAAALKLAKQRANIELNRQDKAEVGILVFGSFYTVALAMQVLNIDWEQEKIAN